MDNGHFQYNQISLGLTLFAIYFILIDRDYISSIFFCLSLNYKQMSLYYSIPFFFYFIGKTFHNKNFNIFQKLIINFIFLKKMVNLKI
jgi:alpha-1,3-glucosyltransferase